MRADGVLDGVRHFEAFPRRSNVQRNRVAGVRVAQIIVWSECAVHACCIVEADRNNRFIQAYIVI